jgi:hypothetical protein
VGNFRGVRLQGFDLNLAPELFLLGGDPIPGAPDGVTYDNQMTILNLTSELDRVVLYCSLQDVAVANFTLRIYRKLIKEITDAGTIARLISSLSFLTLLPACILASMYPWLT